LTPQKKDKMGKSVLNVKGYSVSDIKSLLFANESFKIGVRLYIVYQVALGHSSRNLAEQHRISFKQVTNWVHRFEKEGLEGLKDKKGRGRKTLLSGEKLERIKSMILKENPMDYGFNTAKWTGPLLTQWIKQEYKIEYQQAQIYNLLKKIGIVFKKKEGMVAR